jgi:hypothetical protein
MALFGRESARDEQKVQAYRAWFARQHPFALASAALSVFSLTHFGTLFLDELLGIALGVIALRAVRRGSPRSAKLAYIGIITGALSLICAIFIYAWRPATAMR